MSLGGAAVRIVDGGFPRVSGDEPLAVAIEGGSLTFSPRERG